MNLEIMTPETRLFEGEVKLVQVPGIKGSFEVLKNHAPIISTLSKGAIKIITEKDKKETILISSGIIEVKANHITILALVG
ncbi:MAG: ATP synthase F1 subunit epsilon [Bacteroidales bacterium]|nr:ATP synthase F1 subunit epsilon [Bacteroidales bacterium]